MAALSTVYHSMINGMPSIIKKLAYIKHYRNFKFLAHFKMEMTTEQRPTDIIERESRILDRATRLIVIVFNTFLFELIKLVYRYRNYLLTKYSKLRKEEHDQEER